MAMCLEFLSLFKSTSWRVSHEHDCIWKEANPRSPAWLPRGISKKCPDGFQPIWKKRNFLSISFHCYFSNMKTWHLMKNVPREARFQSNCRSVDGWTNLSWKWLWGGLQDVKLTVKVHRWGWISTKFIKRHLHLVFYLDLIMQFKYF